MSTEIRYSICVANLNMGKTIVTALSSVLDSLDESFEMIVVDDGSTDDSKVKLEELKERYSNLRTVYLKRDKSRTLAETRNISIAEAKGDYCLMHVDCDDYWHPYLKDFVSVFHEIQKLYPKDILLKGHQVNMGKRDFLLENGPYKYGHMVEDRDMWFRFAKMGLLVPLEHVIFRDRMALSKKQKLQKKFLLTGIILRDEIRTGNKFSYYVANLWKDFMKQPLKLRMYKVMIFPICFVLAKKLGGIPQQKTDPAWEELVAVPVKNAKSIVEMYREANRTLSLDQLSEEGKWIFSNKSSEKTIRDLPRL